jgi:hypothetical protein
MRLNKKIFITTLLLACLLMTDLSTNAQCSICTRTAEQLGEGPAKGMNAGILYLAFAPFALVGFIAYRWWRNNKKS